MRKVLFMCAILFANYAIAQSNVEANAKGQATELQKSKDLKEGWTKGGSFNLNISEAGVNKAWKGVKGGETQAIGIRAIVDYDFDKKKGKTMWLNNLRARYGMSKLSSAGEAFLKTDDYLNYTSIVNRELKPKWSVAFFV